MENEPKSQLESPLQWVAKFVEALEPLVGQTVKRTVLDPIAGLGAGEYLCCRQQFGGNATASVWIAAKRATWHALGEKILEAAGLEQAAEDEIENTYFELLNQTAGAFAGVLTSRADREIECAGSSRADAPEDGTWVPVAIAAPEIPETLLVCCAPALNQFWTSEPPAEPPEQPAGHAPGQYGTFDLLLDVELPVSVSFGRASIPIKDVLKLTTGSVVELDRAVTEPVEVVVNNCVVARGEVVVVDGNYGVRISHIVSRDERIRSLT
jgi:flagellar motor switch protein FliN/FliY